MPDTLEAVLKLGTAHKLQAHNLISSRPNEVACWTLQPLPFSMMFERIRFHNGQIPCGFNTPSYLLYLGFRPLIAIGIFGRCQELCYPTRLALMESVNSHVNLKWSESPCNGSAMGNTPLGNSIMGAMGLFDDIIAEVNVLWELTRQDPSVMNRYLKDHSNDFEGAEFEHLTLVDFVKEILIERMNKLLVLDTDINVNLD